MGSSLYLFVVLVHLLLSSFHLLITTAYSFSSAQQQLPLLCHADESSALLQFKQTFSINKSASPSSAAYPKVASWKLLQGEGGDCCSWDGVECDEDTGHVIGLDLSSSSLHGSINSSSSLFSLVHLQRLILTDNDFNYSHIPSEIGLLSQLTSLDLSRSHFSGQIPPEISKLSKLVSLDLSNNVDRSYHVYLDSSKLRPLKLEKLGLRSLVQNMTNLKELYLSEVTISSEVPDSLANLTSLTTLILDDCRLRGDFPVSIFHLPKLQVLDVSFNSDLIGHFPKFHPSSPIRVLRTASTSFSGKLPDSIRNLNFLNALDVGECNLSGSVPSSLGNLTQLTQLDLMSNHFSGDIPSLAGLSQLNYLSLSSNKFNVRTLPRLGKLTELTKLNLHDLNLYGSIPSFLANLTQLTSLDLSSNYISGEIPSQLTNLTHLTMLDLSKNQLRSPIPGPFPELKNLEYLFLSYNSLSLSSNQLTVLTQNTSNDTLPLLKFLVLTSCNLTEFPDFLRFHDKLEVLYLDQNKIHGQIPAWMLNISIETLVDIRLAKNFLTGFEQHPHILPWDNLANLDLSYNMLQGPLPIPPPSTISFLASQNGFTGEIPPLICQMSSLYKLDLSNNNLIGTIPPCLSNFSDSLSVLNLKGNNFQGRIPHSHNKGNQLKMIDFSYNQLQGKVPRSLASCTVLEILDLSNNLIEDTFPLWLGDLTMLQVLILRSNKFYGAIRSPKIKLELPNLRIIDLSCNSFTGDLPTEYFQNWSAMKFFDWRVTYMQAAKNISLNVMNVSWTDSYFYTMTITNKGVNTVYEKIQNMFTAIDLSSNRFEGEIPESIGNLKGLQLLNLSNNDLSGAIPPCLGNLTKLESLDLSQNKLLGEIPQQLALLTFLAFLNVSNNHLIGSIPQGKQFNTFENNSYEGNPGLCGNPLSRKCGKSKELPLSPPLNSKQGNDSAFPSVVDWIVICMGYASGTVVGMVFGHALTTRYHEWFIDTFGRKQHKPRRAKRRRRGNSS